jgi:hypothetical protein
MLLDAPDKTRLAVRHLAREHQQARERADRDAKKQPMMEI